MGEITHLEFICIEIDFRIFFFFGYEISSANTSTLLTMSFKDHEFMVLKKDERYSLTDMISSFGGFVSLFMGISLLTVSQLLFHFTIRLSRLFSSRKTVISRKQSIELPPLPYTS